jgi:AcrR family transcriptional regulator
MRVDAQRNQQRILDAARAQISEHGSDVSMDQIAQSAGVAVGTLYRHYPTKKDLVEAVLTGFVDTLIHTTERAVESLAAPGDAMKRMRELLTDFVENAADDDAIKAAAAALGADSFAPEMEQRGRAALEVLLAAAIRDGDVRAGVTPEDVFLMMGSAPSEAAPEARARWVRIVIAGLSDVGGAT